jgi:uncharacterized protein (TIGR00730 family)
MTRSARRRYELRSEELNRLVEQLVERAQQDLGSSESTEEIRQVIVSALLLLRDEADRGDVKLVNAALKELRHSFRVFSDYQHHRKVAVFGSARTKPEAPAWQQAFDFAERIAAEGWMVITGAGDGIMGAAQGGAGRAQSFGVNIRLPFEQAANPVIAGDPKLINFRYFFTRKVTFVKEAHAIALFPGGFGTLDEGFEALTLIQTGKSEILPVVFVDAPGGSYWSDWQEWVHSHLLDGGLISRQDLSLFRVTDRVEDAIAEILNFYSNYHSSRYRGEKLYLRVRRLPNEAELDDLNARFADLLVGGKIEALKDESVRAGEVHELPCVALRFNRRDMGKLRLLIDTLNGFVAEQASPPAQASRHEIVARELLDDEEAAEEDD